MTKEDILDLVRRCDISDGEVLIPWMAYLLKRKFRIRIGTKFFSTDGIYRASKEWHQSRWNLSHG